MAKARQARAKVIYEGRDISDYVMDFSYTDNYDRTDDISVQLSDRENRWPGEWFPETGATLEAEIEVFDWNNEGDDRALPHLRTATKNDTLFQWTKQSAI